MALPPGLPDRRPASGGDHRLLVGIVHIADTVCCDLKLGFNLTALGQPIDETEMNAIGMSKAQFDEVVKRLPEKIHEASTLFG